MNQPDHLTTLSDGRPGIRSTIHTEIRDDAGNSCLDFISSDETLDRYQEVISASGWKLANYQRNPVFQNAHQYGDIIFTLGRALITEVREVGRAVPSAPPGPCLFQRIQFATDANPMAKIAYALYRGKFLNAVSVGFVPIRWEDPSSSSSVRRRYLEQELLEVSAVGIPANPNALALGLKSGAIEKSDIKDTYDILRLTLESSSSSPSSSSSNHARIEKLIQQFHRILKS